MNNKYHSFKDVIRELDSLVDKITDDGHLTKLRQVINVLKNHSVTVNTKDSELTIVTFSKDERQNEEIIMESQTIYYPIRDIKKIDANGVKYIETKVVADHFGVTTETVRNWIKDKKISGKQFTKRGKWFIPVKEFELLQKKVGRK